jgi:hypothetical protein
VVARGWLARAGQIVMPTVTVEIGQANLNAPLEAWQQAATEAATALTEMIAGEAQANAPVDRGFFRAGVTPNVVQDGLQITGEIGTVGVQYASVIEQIDPSTGKPVPFGRSPDSKFPPLDLIEEWIDRKGIGADVQDNARADIFSRFGRDRVSSRIADLAAINAKKGLVFVIARAIAKRGLPNEGYDKFRPIGRAIEAHESDIKQILTDDLAARIKELIGA